MFIGLLSVCKIQSSGETVSNLEELIRCAFLNNHLCQARVTPVNINTDETLFYPFTVSVKKCAGIVTLYARVFVPDRVKTMNVKVFILKRGVDETRFLVQRESWDCKYGLNKSVYNLKQKWNHNHCRCEWKKLMIRVL